MWTVRGKAEVLLILHQSHPNSLEVVASDHRDTRTHRDTRHYLLSIVGKSRL